MNSSHPSEFEVGVRQLAWDASEDSLFQLGPFGVLVGKRLDQLAIREARGLQIELDKPGFLSIVRPRLYSEFVPSAIEGQVTAWDGRFVAVSVNGTTRAVASTFDGPRGHRRFQTIVPESSLLDGRNRIQVFTVRQSKGKAILVSSNGVN